MQASASLSCAAPSCLACAALASLTALNHTSRLREKSICIPQQWYSSGALMLEALWHALQRRGSVTEMLLSEN